ELIKRIKSNPLMRALRVDKLTHAALGATIASYMSGRAMKEIPALVALSATRETITRRARAFVRRAKNLTHALQLSLIDGFSVTGGGSAPEAQLPTTLISIKSERMKASEIEDRLRKNSPPVIARIVDDQLLLDLRTVSAAEEKELIDAIGRLRETEEGKRVHTKGRK
ncbi:MAG: L-seryl-tRNA(Sec) selenium transferase, partial [Acidobacteria bacterium]|nr:L-seryl-tRNA(Sec) selenium transferase [Acidobacteriota bacterium]